METTYTGHDVIDRDGETVGTVSDVFYEDGATDPSWLVVDPGVFRKERLVPVEGSYETREGKIMVPFDKNWIKDAPKVDGSTYPDLSLRQQSAQHFGLDS